MSLDSALKKMTLEQALNPDPNISEPFAINVDGFEYIYSIKELTDKQISECAQKANYQIAVKKIQHDVAVSKEAGVNYKPQSWDFDGSFWELGRAEMTEFHLLLKELVSPTTGERLFTENTLGEFLTPEIRAALMTRYHMFMEMLDPDNTTTEMVDELLEILKKNSSATQLDYIMRNYSITTILACLFHLVEESTNSPDDSSFGTESSE
jgi:hypothetical protein